MLVYGDRERTFLVRDKAQGILDGLRSLSGRPPGIESHGELVALFIEAGELAQGVADREFRLLGRDADSPPRDKAMAWTSGLARSVIGSWDSGLTQSPPLEPLLENLQSGGNLLGSGNLLASTDEIVCRGAEGFAFYAVYPESYARAASLSGLGPDTVVIGVRSVGTALGGVVQAALGSGSVGTVRPTGHPFRRELRLDAGLVQRILAHGGDCAVVDEGPGLSGSSFGAVIDALAQQGVEERKIHLFPSHDNEPGPRAGDERRARWRRIRRHVVSFDELALHPAVPAHRLDAWTANLIGKAQAAPQDISGGRWRTLRHSREVDWPPTSGYLERRKFLVEAGGQRWLLKFGGLGREGQRKTERARLMAAHGFTPPVAGWRHGFHVERWLDEAHALDLRTIDPLVLAEAVGRYIGFRARTFPAREGAGASLDVLLEMTRTNTAEALGATAASAPGRWQPDDIARLTRRSRPVEVDGRMHAWEWLAMSDGRLLKSDAVDHHASHDLVGCQDMAWDIVGATVELDLSALAQERMCAVAGVVAGRDVDPELLAFLRPCYLAFQLGAFMMAADAMPDEDERGRLRRHALRYSAGLEARV